jgi:hypothetical protein
VKKDELTKVESYLRKTFANNAISVRPRAKKDDSAEVYINDDFVAVLFKDEDDDESYQFQMAILAEDL